jgi:hypothetical protein
MRLIGEALRVRSVRPAASAPPVFDGALARPSRSAKRRGCEADRRVVLGRARERKDADDAAEQGSRGDEIRAHDRSHDTCPAAAARGDALR